MEWVAEGATKDMGPLGKFLFNTGTSMQTLLRIPFGVPGLALAGLSAGSQAAYDAAQRGAIPKQAIAAVGLSELIRHFYQSLYLFLI